MSYYKTCRHFIKLKVNYLVSIFTFDKVSSLITGWLFIAVVFGWGYYSIRFLYFNRAVELTISEIKTEIHLRDKMVEYNWNAIFCDSNGKNVASVNLGATGKLSAGHEPYKVGEKRYFLTDIHHQTYKFIGSNNARSKVTKNLSSITFLVLILISVVILFYNAFSALFFIARNSIIALASNKASLSSIELLLDFSTKATLIIVFIVCWVLGIHYLITLPKLSSFIMGPVIALYFLISVYPIPRLLAEYRNRLPGLHKLMTVIQNLASIVGIIIIFRATIIKMISLNTYQTIMSSFLDFVFNILKSLLNIPA